MEMSEIESLRLQMPMDRLSKMISTLIKKISDATASPRVEVPQQKSQTAFSSAPKPRMHPDARDWASGDAAG